MDLTKLKVKRKQYIPVSRMLEHMTQDLDFELLAGFQGVERPVFSWDVNRPGLALSGYLDYFANDRVQVLGNTEIHFMERMRPAELARLEVDSYSDHYKEENGGSTQSFVRTAALPGLAERMNAWTAAVMAAEE